MTPKTTPSGRDLESVDKLLAFYKDKPDEHVIDTYAPGMTVGHLKTIRIALLRSHAIDSGELEKMDLNVSDYGLKAEYLKGHDDGWNECLEHLKGIGHDENR